MREEAPAVLFATVSFWQGVDVPGDALQLVVLDQLPFASPGDPLASARTEAVRKAGGDWFADEVLPRAGLLLAQGVGRLIRRSDDKGVVAVLDRRLAVAGYRSTLLASLPPLRRTVRFDEVERFFSTIRG
jgi:ATP-dependent DNA helicase DinG